MMIIHTRLQPGEKIEDDENKRYWPYKDMHLLKNVVKLTKEQLRPQEKEPVKTERKENTGRNQRRGRAAKKRGIDFYAENNDDDLILDEPQQPVLKVFICMFSVIYPFS